MLIKLIGGGVMILSAAIWGRYKASEEKKRASSLSEFCSLVKFVGENIERFKTPLPEIFEEYTPEKSDMREFIMAVRKYGIKSAWELNILSIPKEAYRAAEKFIYEIGCGYSDEERELCRYTADMLERILEKLKADMSDRIKMWYSIPPLLVSSVILILL